MRYAFDHLVIAAETLESGVVWAEERLGVPLQAGGKHARYGTHNALLGMADGLYLEVIAVDPEADAPHGPRWFGLDGFDGAPRLVTWVCSAQGLADAPLPEGFDHVVGLTRGDLAWDMAEARGGVLPYDQCHPGLIDWGTTPHPATRLAPSGLELMRLELGHPEAAGLNDALAPLQDARVQILQARNPQLKATLRGADGQERTL